MHSDRRSLEQRRGAPCFLLSWLVASVPASAGNPLGIYVGAGVGQADVSLDRFPAGASNPTSFSEHAAGWKALVGLRPVPWLGVEVEYVDLGHPNTILSGAASATASGVPATAKVNGQALFGLAYLPLALIDVYGKLGVSRLHTRGDTAAIGIVGVDTCFFQPEALGCRPFRNDRQATSLAWAGGVQVKLSAIGLRVDYERFRSGSVRPGLAGLTVSWTF